MSLGLFPILFDSNSNFITNTLCDRTHRHTAEIKEHTAELRVKDAEVKILNAQVASIMSNQTSLTTNQNAIAVNEKALIARVEELTASVKAVNVNLAAQRQFVESTAAKLRSEMNEKEAALNKRIQVVEKAQSDQLEIIKKLQSDSLTITSIMRSFTSRQQELTEIAQSIKAMAASNSSTAHKLDAVLSHLQVPQPSPNLSVLLNTKLFDTQKATDYTAMMKPTEIATEIS